MSRRTMIREWREFRHLTQEELADRIGMSNSTVSRVEEGKIPYSQKHLEAIARVLQCTPADLLTRDPNKDPAQPLMDLLRDLPEPTREQAVRLIRAISPDKAA